MKALTIRQPWASLIADGTKLVETRSWRASYRGTIAIHAAKGWTVAEMRYTLQLVDRGVLRFDRLSEVPRGAVIAIAELVDVVPTETLVADEYGNFTPGRFGWVLADVTKLPTPELTPGMQGLWTWR